MPNCVDCGGVLANYKAKRCKNCAFKDDRNPAWKGKNVGYGALHDWIKGKLGKAIKCQNSNCIYPRSLSNRPCEIMIKPKRFEWANINHKYKRRLKDWIQLCVSCHRLYDNKKLIL